MKFRKLRIMPHMKLNDCNDDEYQSIFKPDFLQLIQLDFIHLFAIHIVRLLSENTCTAEDNKF